MSKVSLSLFCSGIPGVPVAFESKSTLSVKVPLRLVLAVWHRGEIKVSNRATDHFTQSLDEARSVADSAANQPAGALAPLLRAATIQQN